MRFDDGSTPHLSVPGRPEPEPEDALPAVERYTDLGLIGAGGMGEVRAVHDARLDRQVARKTPRKDVFGASEALRREAALTAALEHPGIVPVYDAGEDASGPWYTMRMVRGRSLRAVVADTPTRAERLGLVRAVLTAVEAVAYAHARGVVHCDLKAPNVLLGEHGQVQVVDWGLATSSHARSGGGTPATMAPEQARGEPATTRSDVWGLGMVLLEVLTGEPPHADATTATARDRVQSVAPRVPVEGVPPDLRAIVLRCLRLDPGERYPDASALAADLTRFLDGRLVEAHSYTLDELLRRWLHQHRFAVAAACIALAVVAGVTVMAARRVVAERDTARAAERTAQEAQARSDQSLSQALLLAARTAAARGERAEAETLAVGALAVGPSPIARGVLARFGASPRPVRTAAPPPPCGGTLLRGPEGRIACLEATRLALYGPEGPRWEAPVEEPFEVAFAGTDPIVTLRGNRAVVFDGATGERRGTPIEDLTASQALVSGAEVAWLFRGHELTRIDARDLTTVRSMPCDGEPLAAFAELPDRSLFVLCDVRRAIRLRDGRVEPYPAFGEGALSAYERLAVRSDGVIALSNDRGRLVILDADGVRLERDLEEAVTHLAWSGDLLVALTKDRGARILDERTGEDRGRLPRAAGWVLEDDDAIAFLGRGGERWDLAPMEPVVLAGGPGITGVIAGPEGQLFASRGDGTVTRHDPRTGRLVARALATDRTVKALSARPDGRGLVAVGTGAWRFPWDLSTVEDAVQGNGRRAMPLGGDVLVLPWVGAGRRWHMDTNTVEYLMETDRSWFDAGGSPDGRLAAALADDGGVWLVSSDPGQAPLAVGKRPKGIAVDVTRHATLAVADAEGLDLRTPDGAWRRIDQDWGMILDLALSPDGTLAAVGTLDSRIHVVDLKTGERLATLEGHHERVAALLWLDDSELVSGSWDGTLRRWSLAEVRTPAAALAQTLRDAWGIDVEEALAAGSP